MCNLHRLDYGSGFDTLWLTGSTYFTNIVSFSIWQTKRLLCFLSIQFIQRMSTDLFMGVYIRTVKSLLLFWFGAFDSFLTGVGKNYCSAQKAHRPLSLSLISYCPNIYADLCRSNEAEFLIKKTLAYCYKKTFGES